MILHQCARCRRPVRKPVIVDGRGYGRTCAALVGDLLTQPAPRAEGAKPRRKRADERQLVIAEIVS